MKPRINTNAKIPKKMLNALTEFEFTCIGKGIEHTNEQEVLQFLEQNHSKELALQFKKEFLINTP